MSIVLCDNCEKRVDIDFEEVHDIKDYKMLCNQCFEETEETNYLLDKIDIMIENNQIGV